MSEFGLDVNLGYGDSQFGLSPNYSGGFQGYQPQQMTAKNDSFSGIGTNVGNMIMPGMGGLIGGVGGGAVDMYMNYLESEERKKAERKRLEEARRQQNAARRRADADRQYQMQQADVRLGFDQRAEGRTEETHQMNTKKQKADMLRQAMLNSVNDSQSIRNIFAKRGVI